MHLKAIALFTEHSYVQHPWLTIEDENHVKSVAFFASLKDNKKVMNDEITEEYLIKRYSEVMVFGS